MIVDNSNNGEMTNKNMCRYRRGHRLVERDRSLQHRGIPLGVVNSLSFDMY